MTYNFLKRIRIVLAVFFLIAVIIVCRIFWIQIINKDFYTAKSENQYSNQTSTIFDRGSIFFESKDKVKIGAATIKEGFTLAINPKILVNPDDVYDTISEYIELDKQSFIEKASKVNDPYEEILKKIDKNAGNSVKNLKIPGVILTKDTWRVYPGDILASHSIGLIGFDDAGVVAGRYGLERYYEDVLSRTSDNIHTNVFAEIFSEIKKTVFSDTSKKGDIVTSIEPTTQSYLEKTLDNIKDKWKSDSIGGIIMDPKTGKIFALSSRPTFNPNNLRDISDPKVFSNLLVEDAREMGSIIKPLTMATGIDTGVITIDSKYDDTGFMELNGKKISNFDGRARGITSMQEILSQSLNVGAANIALKIGQDRFSEYFRKLGFGEITGIDQPNEQKGIIKNLDSKRDIEMVTASYGQGIALTPIQTIRALATIANGGLLVTPHIAEKIEYLDGNYDDLISNKNDIRIFKKESTDDVTKMLVKLVDTALKNGKIKMEHYSIAAKTGTAQIANPTAKGYYSDRFLHSFIGYFPAYNPRFIVFLYHVYPKDAEFASETLTDPFIQISKFLINYYELPPDR